MGVGGNCGYHAAPIGSSRLPIFRLVSCPSLVCVQLCFWNESQDVWVAHSLSLSFSLHITSWKLTASSFTGSETHLALSFISRPSPGQIYMSGESEAQESFVLFPGWVGAVDGNQIIYREHFYVSVFACSSRDSKKEDEWFMRTKCRG